jgi:hypothetical protein
MIPFIGDFKNLISQDFLQSSLKLLDFSFLPPDVFPTFKSDYGIKKSTENQDKVGITTLTTFYYILSVLSQGGIAFVALVFVYTIV